MFRAAVAMVLVGFQLLVGSAVQTSAQEDLPQLIKKTQVAVVQVLVYDAEGRLFKHGSAFFVSPEGHLVTRRGVLLGATKAIVKVGENQEFPVKAVLAEDSTTELIKVLVDPPGAPWPFLPVSASLPDAGSRVLALGCTGKGEPIVSEGMVSSFRKFMNLGQVIQISANVLPSVIGGALVNLKGEVVGMVGHGKMEGQEFNFAIPGSHLLALEPQTPQAFAEWAVSHYEEAVTFSLNKAASAFRAGMPEDALSYSRQATRIDPNHAQAHYYLGLAYLRTNRLEEARKEWEVLKKLDAGLAEKLRAAMPTPPKAAEEGDLPQLIQKIKPAVLYIMALDKADRVMKQGSGFFVNGKGYFITNYHVLVGASQARVKTEAGKIYAVTRVLAEDRDADLILAAVVPEVETPYLPITGVLPQIGERVVVVGNPRGLEWSAADGIVSAIRGKEKKFIQISAPISPGSSGSPAVNMKGLVIGVNTLTLTQGQMLNFASSSQSILALKLGPGLTLSERADGWLVEAKELLKKGRKEVQARKYKEALEYFDEAKKTMPELAEARYELCLLYLALGNKDEALEELKVLRMLNPKMAEDLVKRLKAMAK
jgi:S1-C subfamily serine protease